ncbi:Panacea domain-containing protein [Peribacillus tepidiphilus]|uniref:Panacea domain-containing protein n=1 Tax=Peribacillus tepidiphilus TaxID=2652445 RepID=UPI001290BE66|nr:type II toxin-antitoxin system antitoxin SocA domain-containing protein [Peribacillus tepidiphilus]
MAFHFIAIVSDYTSGVRIGWHYADETKLSKTVIQDFIKSVKKKCGDVQLALHKLSTDSISWKSVVEKDAFFDDVVISHDTDEFISLISKDQKLTAYDVAKFILSVAPTSHLKLQKLLYFSYARFLLRTGEKLFKEPIVAFKYGPVVESVFHKFKVHGSSVIDYKEDETMSISTDEHAVTPSFMKIASSEHGLIALDCILDVLSDYSKMTATELVEKTHIKGGPWDRVYKPGRNSLIPDDLITQYHHIVDSI